VFIYGVCFDKYRLLNVNGAHELIRVYVIVSIISRCARAVSEVSCTIARGVLGIDKGGGVRPEVPDPHPKLEL
jgi:hypothetical protein